MCDAGRMSFARFQGEGRLLQPVCRSDGGWLTSTWNETVTSVVGRLSETAAAHGTAPPTAKKRPFTSGERAQIQY